MSSELFFVRKMFSFIFFSSAGFYHEQQWQEQKLSVAEFVFPFVFARVEEEWAEKF